MATGRRGRKTTAKRKPKRKAAPARKKKARAKKAQKKAAKKKRPKARTVAKRTVKKTKPQGARAKMVRRSRGTAASAAPARPPVPESFVPPESQPAPIPRAAAAPAAPSVDDMEAAVERALGMERYDDPDPTAVAVLSAIGRGYAMGPASPPGWLHVDVARPIAEVLAERFAIGDRAHDIDRGSHRPQTRATVNIVLAQTPGDPVGDPERAVLTSFCLGSWDPATDEVAERHAISGFVIPWYMKGRA
jgi:hypothetical protein